MTVKDGLRRLIIKKTFILICVALALGAFCFAASNHQGTPNHYNAHLIYTIISAILSLTLLAYIACKMRYFHILFAKEFTGKIVSVKREVIRSHRAFLNMDEVVMVVMIEGKNKKKKLRLPGNKVGNGIYFEGDMVLRLKGTRFPINLTREVQQHICPICGRDSCSEDTCPDCKIKY